MIQLTQQQLHAVDAGGDTPPTLIDPRTQTAYVLLRKDVFDELTAEGKVWQDLESLAAGIDWERARGELRPSPEWLDGDEPKPF